MTITPKQRELRKKSIGSSDAAVVLGLDKYRNRYDLWLEKTGRTEGFSGNASTERGEFLEDGILRWAASKLGKVVKPSNSFVYTTSNGVVLRAHVDGQLEKYARGSTIVEAKNMVNSDDWGNDDTDEIPMSVFVQVQHQMLCAEASDAWVIRLGTHGFSKHPIEADVDVQRAIIEQSDHFWKFVESDTPPPYDHVTDSMMQYMQQAYNGDGSDTKLDDDHMRMFKHWDQVEKDAKERKKYHKSVLITQMGDSKRGTGSDFRCTMVRGGGGSTVDTEKLKELFPDEYNQCLKETAVYHYPKITKIKKKDDS